MTDRVHRIRYNAEGVIVTACGQRDGEQRPAELRHYVTFRGRVTCPDCLAGRRAELDSARAEPEEPDVPPAGPRQLSLGLTG